jgi:hypothetical protein
MSEDALGPIEGPLMRARLHIRSGRLRLMDGPSDEGIVILYDALNSALFYWAAKNGGEPLARLKDEKEIYAALVRSGVLDGKFNYARFEQIVERALAGGLESEGFRKELWLGLERVFTCLGVMPFDEGALPPEKPETFLKKPNAKNS